MKQFNRSDFEVKLEQVFVPKYHLVDISIATLMGEYMQVDIRLCDAVLSEMVKLIDLLDPLFPTPSITISPLPITEGYLTKLTISFTKDRGDHLIEVLNTHLK